VLTPQRQQPNLRHLQGTPRSCDSPSLLLFDSDSPSFWRLPRAAQCRGSGLAVQGARIAGPNSKESMYYIQGATRGGDSPVVCP